MCGSGPRERWHCFCSVPQQPGSLRQCRSRRSPARINSRMVLIPVSMSRQRTLVILRSWSRVPKESRFKLDFPPTNHAYASRWPIISRILTLCGEARSDGSNLHRLLPGWRTPPNECCGRWTPDGRYYLFASETENGRTDIFARPDSTGFFRHSPQPPFG